MDDLMQNIFMITVASLIIIFWQENKSHAIFVNI